MRTLGIAAAAALATVTASAQDWAVKKLEASPRHQEWAQVKSGERTVHAFVVFPESKSKSTVVIVIHENRGLTDWVRTVADRLASEGYIAIAPDLLSGSRARRRAHEGLREPGRRPRGDRQADPGPGDGGPRRGRRVRPGAARRERQAGGGRVLLGRRARPSATPRTART